MLSGQFSFTLSQNRQTHRIETRIDDVSVGWIDTDASGRGQLIEVLGAHRVAMSDPVPETLDPLPRLQRTAHPRWWVFDPSPDGHELALRHPGYGRLSFLLGPESAVSLAGYLHRPLSEPLKIDAKAFQADDKLSATPIPVVNFVLGSLASGEVAMGLGNRSGSTVFYSLGIEGARTLGEKLIAET